MDPCQDRSMEMCLWKFCHCLEIGWCCYKKPWPCLDLCDPHFTLIPPHRYAQRDNYSKQSIQWMKHFKKDHKVKIQHMPKHLRVKEEFNTQTVMVETLHVGWILHG